MKTTKSWSPIDLLRKMLPASSAKSDMYGTPISGVGLNGSIVARSGWPQTRNNNEDSNAFSSSGDEVRNIIELPEDRQLKYATLAMMAKSPTVAAALNIHISNALSMDKKTGAIIVIEPKDSSDEEISSRCKELQGDLGVLINANLPNWARIMVVFGVSFIRPYTANKKGIVALESDFHTLPHFVQEFVRGGQLAGFTGDFLLHPETFARVMAEPWDLVSLKLPTYVPSSSNRPIIHGSKSFSLLSPMEEAPLRETQNYGASFLEYSYEAFVNLCDALKSLKATRNNAAKIDRLVALATDTLDPANAARYTREVTQNLKRNAIEIQRRMENGNTLPTVMNHVIPVMGAGKGGIVIDTQSIPADISGIEDVMFHLRQLCSSLGVDSTMIGWADQMSGGLGEGGWQQTSIAAAERSNWIRHACTETIHRLIDIHCAFKYGKVFPANDRPYQIKFNSLNTAIQEQHNRELDSRANYSAQLVTIVDAILNNPKMTSSDTFMQYVLADTMEMDRDTVQQIIKEFKASTSGDENDDHNMMESAPADDLSIDSMSHEELKKFIKYLTN
ncbi:phage portal protein [Yersinia ruckeri]|uniref:phage portal protein n=1 Tax=Yersinia ruckeri TaxID=29486 RepID=UPI0020BF9FE7|nr:phage portal protein [Yersinia ruckeri]EKN4689529.1 phage portal protein [Yersinia ruckeri]MCK8586355.1 phage portal protein [Yersinia ruckeri]MCW6615597.1 phage portal protein [Yersinia ruckeri]